MAGRTQHGAQSRFVAECDGVVIGWCSLSPYRPRSAATSTSATEREGSVPFVTHIIAQCLQLWIKTLFRFFSTSTSPACISSRSSAFTSGGIRRVADFDGAECGHVYYGLRVVDDLSDGTPVVL